MKALVVGYGAMGHIIADMLKEKDELAAVVALECEYKKIAYKSIYFLKINDFFSQFSNFVLLFRGLY